MKTFSSTIKKQGFLPALAGILAILVFFLYSLWIYSRPKPFEIQGEAEATQIRVASKITGRLDSIAVKKGDEVKKGQLLYILRSPEAEARRDQAVAAREAALAQNRMAVNGARSEDIEAARNSYLKAEAAAVLAEKTYQRILNLYREGVVTAQKKDEAEAGYKMAAETSHAARAMLDKALQGSRPEDKEAARALVSKATAAISEADAYLTETRIYAPQDGEIANILSEKGEIATAGFPVITLANLNELWFTFHLREDLLSSIRKGSTLIARVPALGNREINLRVTFISPLGQFATWNATKTSGDFDRKTFEITAYPTELIEGLRPGMSALIDWSQTGYTK